MLKIQVETHIYIGMMKKLENGNFSELFPRNSTNIFEEKGNWDLKCYFHGAGISDQNGGGFLLLFYLNF